MPSIRLALQFCVAVPKDLWHCMCCSDFISVNGAPSHPPASFPSPISWFSSQFCNLFVSFLHSSMCNEFENYWAPHPQFGSLLCPSCYSPIDSKGSVCILMPLLNRRHWQWWEPSNIPRGFAVVHTHIREDWLIILDLDHCCRFQWKPKLKTS